MSGKTRILHRLTSLTLLSALLAFWLVPTGRAQNVFVQSNPQRFGILSNWNPSLSTAINVYFQNPDTTKGLTIIIANKSSSTSPTYNIIIQSGSDNLDPTFSNGWASIACTRLNVNTFVFKSNYPSFISFSGEALSGIDENIYSCPVTAMTRYRIQITNGTTIGPVDITGTLNPGTTWQTGTLQAAGDPCANSGNPKSSVVVNIASAGTTQLVALSANKIVYVCGFTVAAGAGTNPSFQLEYGTGATCGTGTTTLTGAMATGVTVSTTTPGPIFSYSSASGVMQTAVGNALCAVAGGTTPNFQGVLTFIQE